MAFPWIFHSNYEDGLSGADSETDTSNQLDVAHYTQLAAMPYANCAPYTGAYCARLQLTGGTADAYFVEGDVDIAANTTRYFSFNIWFSPDFTGTADDTFNIFECLATSTVEATFGGRIVAATNVINLGIGETAPTSFGAAIERGVWYTVELAIDIDNAGADDGTIDIYVTKEGNVAGGVYASQVGSLDQGAVTTSRLGMQNHLATTTGTILIDNFIMDDARIYPSKRFQEDFIITKSAHVMLGTGCFDVSLLSGAGTDNVLKVYDTERAEVNNQALIVDEVKNLSNNERVNVERPVKVQNGAYIELAGTNPRAQVHVYQSSLRSAAAVRDYGRKVTPQVGV